MLKITTRRKFNEKEKGMAFVEAIPVLFMVVVVFNFSLGFFGAIQSGILNSIASYNYTMETFRFRSNLMYFRPGGNLKHYEKSMARVHGVTADGVKNDDSTKDKWPATIREIAFYKAATKVEDLSGGADGVDHTFKKNPTMKSIGFVNSSYLADGSNFTSSPEIWIKTVYGICLNADCKVVP